MTGVCGIGEGELTPAMTGVCGIGEGEWTSPPACRPPPLHKWRGGIRPRCGRYGIGEGVIDARHDGRYGFGEWLGMDGAWRWTGNVDEREDKIG